MKNRNFSYWNFKKLKEYEFWEQTNIFYVFNYFQFFFHLIPNKQFNDKTNELNSKKMSIEAIENIIFIVWN